MLHTFHLAGEEKTDRSEYRHLELPEQPSPETGSTSSPGWNTEDSGSRPWNGVRLLPLFYPLSVGPHAVQPSVLVLAARARPLKALKRSDTRTPPCLLFSLSSLHYYSESGVRVIAELACFKNSVIGQSDAQLVLRTTQVVGKHSPQGQKTWVRFPASSHTAPRLFSSVKWD